MMYRPAETDVEKEERTTDSLKRLLANWMTLDATLTCQHMDVALTLMAPVRPLTRMG